MLCILYFLRSIEVYSPSSQNKSLKAKRPNTSNYKQFISIAANSFNSVPVSDAVTMNWNIYFESGVSPLFLILKY